MKLLRQFRNKALPLRYRGGGITRGQLRDSEAFSEKNCSGCHILSYPATDSEGDQLHGWRCGNFRFVRSKRVFVFCQSMAPSKDEWREKRRDSILLACCSPASETNSGFPLKPNEDNNRLKNELPDEFMIAARIFFRLRITEHCVVDEIADT